MNAESLAAQLGAEFSLLSPFGIQLEFSGSSGVTLANIPTEELKSLLAQHRLILMRGLAPITEQPDFAAQCRRWGDLLEWDFGAVFEVVEHADPQNYLFTSGSVPYHWDGAFATQVPWLQIFQCCEAPATPAGGETLFCNTPALWNALPHESRVQWETVEIAYTTDKVAHYGGAIRVPLVQTHPLTGETVLRFAEPANATTVSLNTPQLEVHGISPEQVPAFLAELIHHIYDPQWVFSHAWQAGDYLIADNHALLHGRTRYDQQSPRRLWRAHVLT